MYLSFMYVLLSLNILLLHILPPFGMLNWTLGAILPLVLNLYWFSAGLICTYSAHALFCPSFLNFACSCEFIRPHFTLPLILYLKLWLHLFLLSITVFPFLLDIVRSYACHLNNYLIFLYTVLSQFLFDTGVLWI